MAVSESMPTPLISAHQLAAKLASPALVIVDVSWYLAAERRDPDAEYRIAHIPGAIRIGLDDLCDPDSDLPHTLPTPERFAARLEHAGIGPDDWVVVYDTSGVNLSAARIWWTFRVFGHDRVTVLDGGFRAWAAETRPVQAGVQRRPHTGYPVPGVDTSLIVNRAQLEAARLSADGAQIIDCRSTERFIGAVPEVRPGVRSGNIPGSRNIPYREFTDPATGRMRSAAGLRQLFEAAGIDPARQAVASCGSGVTACIMALAVEVLRRSAPDEVGPPVAIYDGSWTEYGREAAT